MTRHPIHDVAGLMAVLQQMPPSTPVVLDMGASMAWPEIEGLELYAGSTPVFCLRIVAPAPVPPLPTRQPAPVGE